MENDKTDNAEQIHRHLPKDIVIEILSRLPVRSLLRFKGVCKSWRSFISSKNFIKTHLQNSKRNETFAHHRIISTSLPYLKRQRTLTAYSLYSLLIEPVTHPFSLDFFRMDSSVDLFIVGSCNGLVCVLVDRYRFFLLNPSTRESKELPDFFKGTNLPKERGFINGYGFGFDEISSDYKISALFCMNIPPRTSVARVYSLKADSWGGFMFFKDGRKFDLSGKFVSGKLHWIKDWVYPESKLEILCLDLKSETFEIVERPICLEGYCGRSLGVLKGCLCVSFDSPPTIGFDIWIWSEYGVEDSGLNL